MTPEAITRILCWRSGPFDDFKWPPLASRWDHKINQRVNLVPERPATGSHRMPPLPFHAGKAERGRCRICGQPIYGGGEWRRSAGEQSERLTWHRICTDTYFLWSKTSDYANMLAYRQNGLCAITGEPIGMPAKGYVRQIEIDHRVPLFRVARDHADMPWCELIKFWGLSNLQALSRTAHLQKCAEEARERAGYRIAAAAQTMMDLSDG